MASVFKTSIYYELYDINHEFYFILTDFCMVLHVHVVHLYAITLYPHIKLEQLFNIVYAAIYGNIIYRPIHTTYMYCIANREY